MFCRYSSIAKCKASRILDAAAERWRLTTQVPAVTASVTRCDGSGFISTIQTANSANQTVCGLSHITAAAIRRRHQSSSILVWRISLPSTNQCVYCWLYSRSSSSSNSLVFSSSKRVSVKEINNGLYSLIYPMISDNSPICFTASVRICCNNGKIIFLSYIDVIFRMEGVGTQ